MFNEFIDHSKSDLQNPFLHPQPVTPVFIAPPPRPRMPIPHLAGNPYALGEFGELSGFSKFRKYAWIALVTAGLIGSRVLLAKYSLMIERASMQIPEIGEAFEVSKATQIPVTAMLVAGPALQLFLDKDWPILTYIGLACGMAYGAVKVGPHVPTILTKGKELVSLGGMSPIRKQKRKKKK